MASCSMHHSTPSVDVLPDALLERILALLPFTSAFRSAAVCKRWNSIVSTKAFVHLCEQRTASRPWFFSHTLGGGSSEGWAYDPHDERWLNCCELSGLKKSRWWPVASANGLICFKFSSPDNFLIVCNPMTKFLKKLAMNSRKFYSLYSVSMTANKDSASATIILAQCDYVNSYSQDFFVKIKEYDFSLQKWGTKAVRRIPLNYLHKPLNDLDQPRSVLNDLEQPRSVICKGFFYCVVMTAAHRSLLITYELSSGVFNLVSLGPPPFFPANMYLMNCNNTLVIVGGLGGLQRVTGIGIWEVVGTEWREIARMPDVHFKTLRHSIFSSSGLGDFIYIHSTLVRHLFLYSLTERSWVRIERYPMADEDPSKYYTGICFEPRLKVSA